MIESPHLFTVKRSEASELRKLRDISVECHLSPWSENDLVSELLRNDAIVLSLLEQKTGVVGFLMARTIPSATAENEIDAELYNLAVTPEFQKSGGARLLVNELFSICRTKYVQNVWLDVRASNGQAISLYTKAGFTEVALRKHFYSNPAENGITMKRSL